MDERTAWIENLKPGDDVFLSRPYQQAPELAKVCKLTAKQIVVTHPGHSNPNYESRFWRETGCSVGGGPWHSRHLVEPNEKTKEWVEVARLKEVVREMRGKLSTPNDRATLEAMVAALTPFVQKPAPRKRPLFDLAQK